MDFSELIDTEFSDLIQQSITIATNRSGLIYKPVSTLRTLPQQYAIYAIGRENQDVLDKIFMTSDALASQLTMPASIIDTSPGTEVWTYARTPYTAMHTLGCAIDIQVVRGTRILGEIESSYTELASVFYNLAAKRKMNVVWGGKFSGNFKDYPHFQRCINPYQYIEKNRLDFSHTPSYRSQMNIIRNELDEEKGFPKIVTKRLSNKRTAYNVIRNGNIVESVIGYHGALTTIYRDLQYRYYGKIIV